MAKAINVAGTGWMLTLLGLSVVALIIVFRRWRHLLVFIGSLFFLEQAGTLIYDGLARPALVEFIQRTEGLALCGRGAACPG